MELREKAILLIDKYIKNQNLKKHLFAAEAVMQELAEYFGEDKNLWGLAGLLHDLDWEITKDTPEKHSLVSAEILKKEGFPEEVVNAVKVHNHLHKIEPKTLIEKALFCSEELTGLIVACALVNPKKLDGVRVDSVLKKFKEKSFARGVDRSVISRCEELIGISLEKLIELELKAMKKIKDILEL